MTTSRNPGERPSFLSLHTAVVLMGAAHVGYLAGGLSFLGGTGAALSALAGLGAAGASVPALRGLIR
ncbi:hypothetical protein ACGFXC_08430 [Streptomyces sp. NPDC048507]|uniref:hypothetical protein n=1 Tax=Streptomyces sp. NPDC048507 TaxID=3365560 RepID=UPI0037175B90